MTNDFHVEMDSDTGLNAYRLLCLVDVYFLDVESLSQHGINCMNVCTVPRYREDHPVRLELSGNIAKLNWTNSFDINAELDQFVLFFNSTAVYIGPSTTFTTVTSSAAGTNLRTDIIIVIIG